MTIELTWLAYTTLLTACLFLPYVVDRFIKRGIVPTLTDKGPETGALHSPWALRAIAAHKNAVENLAVFAPAVLLLHAANISTPTTQMAVTVYFFARLVHYLVYTLGIPLVRTLAFLTGWAATIALLGTLLGWF